jgi:hypothetical protein
MAGSVEDCEESGVAAESLQENMLILAAQVTRDN